MEITHRTTSKQLSYTKKSIRVVLTTRVNNDTHIPLYLQHLLHNSVSYVVLPHTHRLASYMKRNKTFQKCDDMSGWEIDTSDSRDHRLCKHLREHQHKISMTPMLEEFTVVETVDLPKTMLVDIDAVDVKCTEVTVDRGDVYEAFWRTPEVSIRGTFVNGEPVWGEAEYRNGMSYTGSFKGAQAHGFGVKRMGDSMHKGRFEKGLRHGRGILVEASRHRLYAGMFHHDKPHGTFICILFFWCAKTKTVQHKRRLLEFDNGTLTSSEIAPNVNVSQLSGLAPEEFLVLYRHAEKLVEDNRTKKLLRDTNADKILWTPVGL